MTSPPTIVVAALITTEDGRILLTRRPEGAVLAGRWEFPGGKIERGECPEAALERECHEELGCRIETGRIYEVLHGGGPKGDVLLLFYRARIASGTPRSMEGNALAWVTPAAMGDYDLLDADRVLPPLFERDFPHFLPRVRPR